MSTFGIILLILGALLLVLFLGGLYAVSRRRREGEARFRAQVAAANEAQAAAHAEDNGWDRAVLDAAAREAAGAEVTELHLVEVVDRPGMEADEAVFRAVLPGGTQTITLGRREDGGWYRVS